MDERGTTNTPMSLSTRSSHLSEANTATSESSLNTPERHELRKSPMMKTAQEAAVKPASVGGGGKANGNKATQAIHNTHCSY